MTAETVSQAGCRSHVAYPSDADARRVLEHHGFTTCRRCLGGLTFEVWRCRHGHYHLGHSPR